MAKQARIIEQEFLANIIEETGHSLEEWMALITESGETKTNAIIKWIKSNHALNHRQASMLAGIFLNAGKPVYDYEVMFGLLFEKRAHQRPLYDQLITQIQETLPEVEAIPTKSYVSLETDYVFGCIKITNSHLRLGLDLGDESYDGILQPAKGLGAMPNIGHMIELKSSDDLTDEVLIYVEQAYGLKHRMGEA
ncbi:MAG: DUF5655 domain-containing protein [Anaerolineae bacterium]